eukprot:CAMPEP_0180018502 /NCGR_PEP_ID=MMETSP0984-20121128/20522_1 /TAXON_ID=483367 /ORGANISM="non described non described, Strain CCMP 2436" /LENGTH=80 /DNA_ID=CAMNT_0021941803 /DNA_START=571 /DNA_END=813 /DNA_ORIENTATION=+
MILAFDTSAATSTSPRVSVGAENISTSSIPSEPFGSRAIVLPITRIPSAVAALQPHDACVQVEDRVQVEDLQSCRELLKT